MPSGEGPVAIGPRRNKRVVQRNAELAEQRIVLLVERRDVVER